MSKRALITGITGQDGSYLAELLLSKGYEVYGVARRLSAPNEWRIEHLKDRITIIQADLLDQLSLIKAVEQADPHEFYNLAAMSFVPSSWDQPMLTGEYNSQGVTRALEAVRRVNPKIRFYQASTSEMFGKVQAVPQREDTPFHPRSPYGVAKLFGHWITLNYREAHGIFGASGILFNHESPLRGREFVTRKITDSMAKIRLGRLDVVELGNLDAKRDWGYAKDYVDGMWRMLQAPAPDTFVLATNRTETVRDFVRLAGQASGFDLVFEGHGDKETAIDRKSGRTIVRVNPKFYRPAEVELLIGDPGKAERELGWKATTTLEELAAMMVEADIRRNERGVSY